jgi:Ras-related protein Rab-7A
MRGADCCILAFDINSKQSFEKVRNLRDSFLDIAEPDDEKTFPFGLLGNKKDKDWNREVSQKTASEWAQKNNNMLYLENSATESVEELFLDLAKYILKKERPSTAITYKPDDNDFDPESYDYYNEFY